VKGAELRRLFGELRQEMALIREELRDEFRGANAETRRYIDVVAESLHHDIQLVAEGVLNVDPKVDREREYTPAEAVALVRSLASSKFDESIEVHVRTGLNVRHADEQLRGTVALPNGVGKDVKIAVFAQGDKAREAEEAGADVVGAQDLANISGLQSYADSVTAAPVGELTIKLRALKADDNTLVLKTDMGAGHAGPSGRYDAWRDEAFVLAFVLDAVGVSA